MGKKVAIPLAFFICLCGFTQTVLSQEKNSVWSYTGKTGPTHWGELSRDYTMCQQGMNQSPIDIVDATFDRLFTLVFDYRPSPLNISKRNHSFEIDYSSRPPNTEDHSLTVGGQTFTLPHYRNYNSRIIVSGEVYALETIRFHAPSEHSVEHKHYAMEAQMIHRDKFNQIAIVAILFDTGEKNPFIEKLWNHALMEHTMRSETSINMAEFLPEHGGYYHYRGSLTTPPCKEGVRWFVMKETLSLSQEQLGIFTKEVGVNNRPKQPRNYRFLLESL